MIETNLLQNYLLVGAILFGLGLVGFLSRRNMIVMFLCVEMMLQGVSISLIGWGRYHDNWGGQMLVIFILTVAACEAAIVMALVMMLFHRTEKLDIAVWQSLREDNQPEFVEPIEPEPHEEYRWPHLTPAGVQPEHDPEETAYRSHV